MARTSITLTETMHPPSKKARLRKGTFSCLECKRRKKRCIISAKSHAGICDSCHRLGCPCLGQENELSDCSDDWAIERRIEHVERLAASLYRKQQQHTRRKAPRLQSACPVHALTGAGEDRMSRCQSLSGYFYSILPHPFMQGLMAKHGKAAYQGLREPLKLSKTSTHDLDGKEASLDVQTACLARRLIRMAVSLMYMDATASDHLADLHLTASAMETAQRYVEAARHMTENNELLLSSAGLECVMMEGHWSIHLGRIEEGAASFRRALHLAQRIELPRKAVMNDEDGLAARIVSMRLVTANRSLSLFCGEPCEDFADDIFDDCVDPEADPSEHLKRHHVRIWKRIVARNVRIESAWKLGAPRDSVLNEELLETLHIDREMKQATFPITPTWWQLPELGADTDEGAEKSFTSLNVSKDHFNTVVLTHLPYVLQASTTTHNTSFIYNKLAAISASREVLLRFSRFQEFKHVPASYRALERKAFIAAVVLLLAHMHSHRAAGLDAVEHERPKDLNALLGTIDAMEAIFSNDRHNPGSECARKLRQMMEIEEQMAFGLPYSITCSYDKYSSGYEVTTCGPLFIELPYFGNIRVEPETSIQDIAGSQTGFTQPIIEDLSLLDWAYDPSLSGLTAQENPRCTFSNYMRSDILLQQPQEGYFGV